jgi:hypothetical protein
MKKTVYVIATLALLSNSAQAWEVSTSCVHSRFYGTSSCRTVGFAYRPQIRDETREAEDYKAKQQSIQKWEAFCKPTRTYDSFGVVRLVYARSGCEFGRSE